MKDGNRVSQQRRNSEAQPLHEEGRHTLSLCQEVLRHYKSSNALVKGTVLKLGTGSNDQDKKDVLEIIDRGRQLGEKIVNAAVSPSAGNGPLVPAQPESTADELVAGFFKASLTKTVESSKGKGTWGLWMAMDKVVRLLQEEVI